MDTIMEGPERISDKTAVQRSEGGGMLILPWTKQILCVLWEHLRLLLHVVYYSFLAVFQMFRLEVHLRITDEAGHPRVQHVSASGSPAESFFLNSLFDGNGSVFMPGSGSLSKRGVNTYAGASHAGALLSSFGAEDLCLSLVDDFVIRAQESLSDDTHDDFCLGHHPAWKRKGPADWEVRVTEECQREAEACCSSGKNVKVEEAVPDRDATVEKSDSFWDEEEEEAGEEFDEEESQALWDSFSKSADPPAVPDLDAAVEKDDSFWDEEEEEAGEEFDEQESRALWDSFSKSSDPYNPLSFSACISTSSDNEGDYASEGADRDSANCSAGDGSTPQPFRKSHPDWVRPGSDSEGDWDSSDDSGGEDDAVEEENERLWELFANPPDPYNPLHFTACAASSGSGSGPKGAPAEEGPSPAPRTEGPAEQDGPPGPQTSRPAPGPSDCAESDGPSCSDEEEEEEEEELWNSFAQSADPYHPLHFRACLQTSPTAWDRPKKRGAAAAPGLQRARRTKPRLPKRHLKRHCCVQTSQEPPRRLAPWKKPGSGPGTHLQTAEKHGPKKVRFSPLVRVHVMWAWSYAMQAVRRGPWEEMARDRARFQRRIQETEQAIGYCLHQSHREKMLDCLSRRQNMAPVLRL